MNEKAPYEFEVRERCPACDGARLVTLFRSAFSDPPIAKFVSSYYKIDPDILAAAPYQLDQCAQCGLVFQKYVGGPELLSDLYTHWVVEPTDPELEIDTYREDIRAIRLSRDAHEIMAASAYLGVPLNELRTLDYGMGWALWARIAAELGCQSYGSDLSRPRMAFAARHGVSTLEDEELGSSRFHFINTEQVFEHVPHPKRLLERLIHALRPGGVVKISVPSADTAAAVVQSLSDGTYRGDYPSIIPVQPLEHINSYRRETIVRMAKAHRLAVVRPPYGARFAFLRHRGTLSFSKPKKAAKELVRPWYQFRNPSNIYMWLQKADSPQP